MGGGVSYVYEAEVIMHWFNFNRSSDGYEQMSEAMQAAADQRFHARQIMQVLEKAFADTKDSSMPSAVAAVKAHFEN